MTPTKRRASIFVSLSGYSEAPARFSKYPRLTKLFGLAWCDWIFRMICSQRCSPGRLRIFHVAIRQVDVMGDGCSEFFLASFTIRLGASIPGRPRTSYSLVLSILLGMVCHPFRFRRNGPLDRLTRIGRIPAFPSPSRAPYGVTRDHQIPFRGARPDLHSPAFALMAAMMRRSTKAPYIGATALVNHQIQRNLHDSNHLRGN